jgi:hypothetical protein
LRGPLTALAVAGLLLAACGSSDDADDRADAADATTTTAAPATTTTTEPLPPGGRRPTAEDPLRVLMAGDSLMADVSLAISSTIQDGGSAVAKLVAAPSIARDDVTRALWRQQLDEFDPEVIVVMIGVWEGMAEDALTDLRLGSPAWEREYRQTALIPYVDLLTSQGATIVWIGMPPSPDLRRALEWSSMNRAVRTLSNQRDDLAWVPGDELLAHPDGSWADILPGPQGNPQRVRRIDTTHLCAEGAVRLARPVLHELQERYEIPLAENWPTRDWRWVFPPDECPPAEH